MPRALVTGATAGIGHAFAQKLAADGYELVLVARDLDRLRETAAQLREAHGVEIEILSADLVDRAQLEWVAQRLTQLDRPVDLLVNNAGFAVAGPLLATDIATQERLVDLSVRAVLVLTRAGVPGMVARGRGGVVTVAGVDAFLPRGTLAAANAWAMTFTMSLRGELAGTGVTATALCPGYVKTEIYERAGIDVSSLPGWLWVKDDRLVRRCLIDVGHRRALSVPTLRYGLGVFLLRHLPLRMVLRLARTSARRRERWVAGAPSEVQARVAADSTQTGDLDSGPGTDSMDAATAMSRRGRRAAGPAADSPNDVLTAHDRPEGEPGRIWQQGSAPEDSGPLTATGEMRRARRH